MKKWSSREEKRDSSRLLPALTRLWQFTFILFSYSERLRALGGRDFVDGP